VTRVGLFRAALTIAFATQLHAETKAVADSTSFPSRVSHRSRLEEAAALPGRLVYLPIQVAGYGIPQAGRHRLGTAAARSFQGVPDIR
jgi:hypothetical protein